jgi:RNA polymerase sigma factor (sigma-70 family)
MDTSPADESTADAPVTWDDVAGLMRDLKAIAHGMLASEGNAGTVHTTQLLNDALKKLTPRRRDWREVSWENRDEFFKDAFFAMRRTLIDYARRRKVRNVVKVGGFESEHLAPLVEAGVLNFDRLVDHAAERAELAEAIDAALAEIDRLHPGDHLAEIVQHRIFNGLTQAEIARLFGITVKTVYNRTRYAYGLLRIALAGFFSGHNLEEPRP